MKITVTIDVPPEEVIAIQKNLLENSNEQVAQNVRNMVEQFQQLWFAGVKQMLDATKK